MQSTIQPKRLGRKSGRGERRREGRGLTKFERGVGNIGALDKIGGLGTLCQL